MEAVCTSETSVNIYLTTRQYIPEDSKLHKIHCCTNYRKLSLLGKLIVAQLVKISAVFCEIRSFITVLTGAG
jgi:hypothetical protein